MMIVMSKIDKNMYERMYPRMCVLTWCLSMMCGEGGVQALL